jgi:hypothetical protein
MKNNDVIGCVKAEYVILGVGCTGIEPVTSCLSSKRSEPTELTPLLGSEVNKNRIIEQDQSCVRLF